MALTWLLVVLVVGILIVIFVAMVAFLIFLVRSSKTVRPDIETTISRSSANGESTKRAEAKKSKEEKVHPSRTFLPSDVPTITITKASIRSTTSDD